MNMFTRKPKPGPVDELNRKKTAAKILDSKRDLNSRLKYLKSYIESSDNISELKSFFDLNYSHVFYIFYESFIQIEANIKNRYNKQNKDDLDNVLFVFLKILLLQPDRLHLRWQCRSIGRIIQKLIHIGNTKTIKFNGIRLFLIWYQILNTNKTHVEELMFQKLIQGFDTFHSSNTVTTSMGIDLLNAEAQKVFNSVNTNTNDLTLNVTSLNSTLNPANLLTVPSASGASATASGATSANLSTQIITTSNLALGKSIYPYEITPIIPIQPNEQTNLNSSASASQSSSFAYSSSLTSEMLKEMLEYMQQDCVGIEWQGDKLAQSQRCYEFLFDEFKRFYLSFMFPNPFLQQQQQQQQNTNNTNNTPSGRTLSISSTSSAYTGVNQCSLSLNVYSNLDLLSLVNENIQPSFERPVGYTSNLTTQDERKLVQLHCKEEIIKWLISVLQTDQHQLNAASSQLTLTSSSINTQQILNSKNDDLVSGYETLSSSRSINSDLLTLKPNQEDAFSAMSISDQFGSSLFDRNSITSLNTMTTTLTNSTNSSQQSNNKLISQRVILSTNLNVNLVHEILRNTYFLNFENHTTVQQVLTAYKKWFLKETNMPSFMLEPLHMNDINLDSPGPRSIMIDQQGGDDKSISSNDFMDGFHRTSSVSSSGSSLLTSHDSLNQSTRIGYLKCLQIFFFHSSNLLLNKNNITRDKIKNICCFTLDIYKLFIRSIKMDYYTWTMLIKILLRIAETLFNSEYLTNTRNDPSTSTLIKLITETVLLAIVKASFSFNMSIELWDQLMQLMSSVNSNSDVIDKWIEVIDDLIRQVFKSCYKIDINNLPETDKRKIKKKYNNGSGSNLLVSNTIIQPVQPQQQQQQQIVQQIQTKPRSRTEIYSPQSSASTTTLVNSPIIPHHTILTQSQQQQQQQQQQATVATPLLATAATTHSQSAHNSQSNAKSIGNANSSSTSQGSMSQSISSTVNVPAAISAVQPLLTRQPSTKIQNTFRDDTYLHILGNMTIADIESTKSPSLSDEHFLGSDSVNKSNTSSTKKLNHSSSSSSNTPNKSKKLIFNHNSFNNNNNNSDMDSSNQEEDLDDSYDKSSTLKANNQIQQTISATTSPNTSANSASRPINNKFSSDKSIYFSSEVLAEPNNNSNSNNTSNTNAFNQDNDNSSNSSNSQTQNISFISSSPPPLPLPIPSNIKFSPQPTTISQQPPPLPPLPPELASKYALNKTALHLDTLDTNATKPQTNYETTSLDSSDSFKQASNETSETRPPKGTSTCSELDIFYMNSSAPHIDTPSEAASISGADLSGEIYASPVLNANSNSSESITPPPPSSSFLPPPLPAYLTTSQTTDNLLIAANSSATNNNEFTDHHPHHHHHSTNGLLLIDQKQNSIDERSGSFIDSKFIKEAKSKGSTLTASTTLQDMNQLASQTVVNTRQSGITAAELHKINNALLASTSEKETANCLIKRLFGCLGNVNAIKDPLIHKKVFEFIHNKWDRLSKIKESLKLSDLSQLVPSITYFAPWLFEAIYQLSSHYQSGKLIAYKTICRIGIKSSNNESEYDSVSDEFMDLFYLTIHQGLHSDDKNIVNCIIQNCGTRFWHCMMPSCTLLLKDFILACANIDKEGPKYDASSILGCLICFPDYFGDTKVLKPPPVSIQMQEDQLDVDVCSKEELKNLIIKSITNFNDDIFNNNSRCVILCALTCFIYEEILNQRWHPRLNDAIKRIFKDLDFRENFNPVLVKMSCDNLRFLSVLANLIFQYEIQYAINIINELNQCLVKLINSKPAIINEDYEKAIIANMFALLEWCMSMPLERLKDQDRATLLRNNFKLIIHICNTFKQNESIETEHIHLAARFIIHHLLTQLNHFPFGSSGPSKIVSSVNETSDLGLSNDDELSTILFEQPNLQFFTVNNQFLISFIELPIKGNEHFFNINSNLKYSSTICRFIVRDFCGKNCWDCCILQSPDEKLPKTYFLDIPFFKNAAASNTSAQLDDSLADSTDESNKLKKQFDYTQLPFIETNEIPKDIDVLDNVLKYISYSSPECRLEPSKPLNILWDFNANLSAMLKLDDFKQKLVNQYSLENKHTTSQHNAEMQLLQNKQETFGQQVKSSNESPITNNSDTSLQSYFNLCKSFVHQLGLLSWEKRQSFNLLRKTPQLLRELKCLDDQTCRETHKIALIYIAEGQDEKIAILSNERGSQDYEEFLSMLAWSVDLETHEGFMGGLQHNYQIKTAPYYANSICEVLFHVATQMNNQNDPNKISKWRHLGNDSVQIIWSEHNKDYDRNILATEFADVIICIYPLKNGLYRIQITKKSSVGYFGPLFDGAIINKQALPTLIRQTAINASRVLLSNTKGYQDFFVHRAHSINNIIKTLTEKQTFEQFISDIYSPASPPSATGQTSSANSAATVSTTGSNTIKKDNQDNADYSK